MVEVSFMIFYCILELSTFCKISVEGSGTKKAVLASDYRIIIAILLIYTKLINPFSRITFHRSFVG